MNRIKQIRAFTIIELLVVIGIITVLAVALLVVLNPAEAQRRARDSARLKDANSIQSILEQYLNDGNAPPCTTLCETAGVGLGGQSCSGNNWLDNIDVCKFASTIPVDPVNDSVRNCVGTGSTTEHTLDCTMIYRLQTQGTDYEINIRQESLNNQNKVSSSLATGGSTLENWLSFRSSPSVVIITALPL